VVGLVGLTALLGFLAAVQREQYQLLGELVRRYAVRRVLATAATAGLSDFDRPEFHDRLTRARYTAEVRPLDLAVGLVTTSGAVAGTAGMAAALVSLTPMLAVLVLLSAVPLWFATRYFSQARYRFDYRMTATVSAPTSVTYSPARTRPGKSAPMTWAPCCWPGFTNSTTSGDQKYLERLRSPGSAGCCWRVRHKLTVSGWEVRTLIGDVWSGRGED